MHVTVSVSPLLPPALPYFILTFLPPSESHPPSYQVAACFLPSSSPRVSHSSPSHSSQDAACVLPAPPLPPCAHWGWDTALLGCLLHRAPNGGATSCRVPVTRELLGKQSCLLPPSLACLPPSGRTRHIPEEGRALLGQEGHPHSPKPHRSAHAISELSDAPRHTGCPSSFHWYLPARVGCLPHHFPGPAAH